MTPETAALPVTERGELRIDPGVVRKIAQHAADEVPGTARVPRRIAGVGAGSHGAHVRVRHAGDKDDTVDLAIDLALHYPAAIRDVVDRVRARVVGEVARGTGFQVRSLDITVSALLPDLRPRVE
ncbi:Asp23/Gls24 family envelope stress response protein [Saccharothrix deserti]|uniref:Asp23/Gls24 family envelope stress response protein n=1 Tax=Saccharothrix deserti TaxID=2593674 RepID=UPI00131B700D|nr:Asp23/Gls24 family envelope stress response protein [Saccharothrix deserti]